MTKLLGENALDAEVLATMRQRGGTWACYQNHDLGHREVGHLRFLKYGPDCTFSVPPASYPDTPDCIGWRYLYVGTVNLEKGIIEQEET